MKEIKMQTPCYIFHKEILQKGIELLQSACKEYWPRAICGYSFKTNSLPWVVEQMKAEGFYAEVVSGDEYDLAKKLGFEHIIYNGPVKRKESFLEAAKAGHIINLDAERELEWVAQLSPDERKKVSAGIRVNFNLEKECPGETSAGADGSRFGFSVETGAFERAMQKLKRLGVNTIGIHLHVGSKTRSLAIYRALAREACKLKRTYHLKLSYVDLGGGYFGGMDNKPKFPDYLQVIVKELNAEFSPEETTLILEPGTSIVTPAADYLTEVVDVKDIHTGRIVTVDGSRIDVDPLHTKSSYFYEIVKNEEQNDSPVVKKQVICGLTCMENDRLFSMEDQPQLQVGDRILFHKVGGYTMCLTPLFIRYFPAVYAVENGETKMVRKPWTPEEYLAGNVYQETEGILGE